MAARPDDPRKWMVGAIRCLMVQEERLERQLADASEFVEVQEIVLSRTRRSARCRWFHVNECNSALPRKLGMHLNFRKSSSKLSKLPLRS